MACRAHAPDVRLQILQPILSPPIDSAGERPAAFLSSAAGFVRTVGSVRHYLTQSRAPSQSPDASRGNIHAGAAKRGVAFPLTSIGLYLTERLRNVFDRYRPSFRRLFAPLSAMADLLLRSDALGGRLLHFVWRCIAQQRGILVSTLLITIRCGLGAAVQIHLAAGHKERARRAARVGNLLFRYEIRNRTGLAARTYVEALFFCARYDEIGREFPHGESLHGYFLNYFVGVSHLYMLQPATAEYFLQAAVRYSSGQNSLAIRQLGRAFLLRDDINQAAQYFQRSVDIVRDGAPKRRGAL
jgi:hypothetical protein